ncbi:MAG: sigma-70 family RNA polymerase sigma factor, partial [Phycisphaerae bacterium]
MSAPAIIARSARQIVPKALLPGKSVLGRLRPEDRELLGKILSEPIEYVDHPSFHKRNAEKELFGAPAEMATGRVVRFLPPPSLLPREDETIETRMATFTAEQEQLAFQRFNYARYRLYRLVRSYRGKRLTLSAAKQLIAWQKRALQARTEIVQANVPLVLAMAKRTRLSGVDFSELISEGNMALLRSVDKFDCGRGFKFSTYACRAILKSFSRVAMRASRYRGRFPIEFDPSLEKSDYLETRRERIELEWLDELRQVIAKNAANLNEIEQKVLRARFGLDAPRYRQPAPMTLE